MLVADPMIGRLVANRYLVMQRIGTGGMGNVYRGRRRDDHLDVALKVSKPADRRDSTAASRFQLEALIMNRFRHPNIVRLLDAGHFADRVFLVEELLEGAALSSVIQRGPMAARRVASIITQLCNALEAMHAAGFVHRDLKPGNVYVATQPCGVESVKLFDFGLAQMRGGRSGLTAPGRIVGTAMYMAPEQARGLPVDGRADIYALGVIAYQMVSGRPPFEADSPVTLLFKHQSQTPPAITEPIPEPLGSLIADMMAKSPEAPAPTPLRRM